MIKAIVFDIGGVLINYETSMCYEYVAKKHRVNRAKYIAMIGDSRIDEGTISVHQLEKEISSAFHIPISDIKYDKVLEIMGSRNAKVFGIAKALSKKYRLALLSDVSAGRWRIAKQMIDTDMFGKKFLSYKMRATKPSRKVYLNVLKGLRLKPQEILFIDNLQPNVNGAKKLGINAIWYRNPLQLKNDIIRLLKTHNGANSW